MRGPAEVVLCAVQAPRQDGFWLAARLRERFPETALILVTDSSDVPPLIQLPEGVVAYLVMPFGREGVIRAVRLGLAWHQMSKAIRAKKDGHQVIFAH